MFGGKSRKADVQQSRRVNHVFSHGATLTLQEPFRPFKTHGEGAQAIKITRQTDNTTKANQSVIVQPHPHNTHVYAKHVER